VVQPLACLRSDHDFAHPNARGEAGIELHFEADMPLEQLERRLHRAGYPVAEVATDRDFGEQLRVRTPDGFDISISQRE